MSFFVLGVDLSGDVETICLDKDLPGDIHMDVFCLGRDLSNYL
jgi:hypothetical protein